MKIYLNCWRTMMIAIAVVAVAAVSEGAASELMSSEPTDSSQSCPEGKCHCPPPPGPGSFGHITRHESNGCYTSRTDGSCQGTCTWYWFFNIIPGEFDPKWSVELKRVELPCTDQ